MAAAAAAATAARRAEQQQHLRKRPQPATAADAAVAAAAALRHRQDYNLQVVCCRPHTQIRDHRSLIDCPQESKINLVWMSKIMLFDCGFLEITTN